MGNDDRWMSGWEKGEKGEAGFESELGGWCSFVRHGLDGTIMVDDMTSVSVVWFRRRRRR